MLSERAIKLHEKIAFDFATALANSEFEQAHDMLGSPYKLIWGAEWLRNTYEEMTSYWDDKAIGVKIETSMTDWPDRREDDIGWAYASIFGNEFAEAVAVISYNEGSENKIRDIEWGRP